MSFVPIDPVAERAGAERQLGLLTPVLDHLRATTGQHLLAADDWRGPAAEAAAGFLTELRARLHDAERQTDDVVRGLRQYLAMRP